MYSKYSPGVNAYIGEKSLIWCILEFQRALFGYIICGTLNCVNNLKGLIRYQ